MTRTHTCRGHQGRGDIQRTDADPDLVLDDKDPATAAKNAAGKMKNVDPVTATDWLIENGLQKEIGTRPGRFLRSLCLRGVITGAEKCGSKWQIKKNKVR